MWVKLCACFLLIALAHESEAKRKFVLGHRVGGNVLAPPADPRRPRAGDEWFTQLLDHFDYTNTTTWQQRFFSNAANYREGGPVFLFIGGESEANEVWMNYGSWIDYARQYNALLFQVEHRFYGASQPTEDVSVDSLKYLKSTQALADLAKFIVEQNQIYNLPSDVKWIAFGGSYSGSLAAWLRVKYPHLVHGAVSSSGPLEAIVDFTDYFKVVGESLATYSPSCVTTITEGLSQIEELIKTPVGQENLNQIFKVCDPIQPILDDEDEVASFYSAVAGNFAGVVQYNLISAALPSINDVCSVLTDASKGTAVERLGLVNDLLLDEDEPCLDYRYHAMIDEFKNTSWASEDVDSGIRQWLYQTCTEFGFYQTSSDESHEFGNQFPVETYIRLCQDLYDEAFDADFIQGAVDRTNTFYGALDIDVSNVVFFHGSIDPWHPLGITKTLDERAPAIFVDGVAHCASMYPVALSDSQGLRNAKAQIGEILGTWLG